MNNPVIYITFFCIDDKRSVIQVAELKYVNGEMSCNRDEAVSIKLTK